MFYHSVSGNFQRSESCHVFVLRVSDDKGTTSTPSGTTDGGIESLYGVCVVAREIATIYTTTGPVDVVTPTCYCFLSKYPFFALHTDMIHALLSILHLHR